MASSDRIARMCTCHGPCDRSSPRWEDLSKAIGDVQVVRGVSCGEHHVGAVSEVGVLYTWGRGTGHAVGCSREHGRAEWTAGAWQPGE